MSDEQLQHPRERADGWRLGDPCDCRGIVGRHGRCDGACVAVQAEARRLSSGNGGWFVFWHSPTGYGSRGINLSEDRAKAIAAAINETGDINVVVTHA